VMIPPTEQVAILSLIHAFNESLAGCAAVH
jgi:hypothetical protein